MKKLIAALFGLVLATSAHAQGTFLGTNPMIFETGVTSLTEAMRIDSSQRVMVDATGSGSIVNTSLAIVSASGLINNLGMISYGNNLAGPQQNWMKTRSTTPSGHGLVSSGDILGTFAFQGDDGAAYQTGGQIISRTEGTPSASHMPARLEFWTNTNSTSTTEAMRIDSNQHVNYSGTTPTASSCAGFALGTGSSDTAGRVSFTSATSCAISFGKAFTNAPFCTVTPGSAASTVTATTSTTVLTATFGTANTAMFYECHGT